MFRLSGPIDADVEVTGEHTRAGIAWVWLVDGVLDGVVTEVPFEPLVYRYALDVEPPPDPSTGTHPSPSAASAPGIALLVGVPLLVEPAGPDVEPVIAVESTVVLDYVSGARPDLGGAVTVTGGRWAAVTSEHLLVLVAAEDEAISRLATAPTWDVGGPLCRLDGAIAGLTLYRSVGDGCHGWRSLAEPGARTEFQGIPMSRPPE